MTILVTGGAGFIGSNFVLDWLRGSDEPVVNLDALTYAGNLQNLASLAGDHRYDDRLERVDAASRQALIQDLDYVFSRIVRLQAADSLGNCECYTCNSLKHWSLQQCGHYVPRGNMALRWDFRNCRVQCKNCNEALWGKT